MSGGSLRAALDKSLEQQIDLGRIDAGDADAITDRAVGRRPAPLAENSARARYF